MTHSLISYFRCMHDVTWNVRRTLVTTWNYAYPNLLSFSELQTGIVIIDSPGVGESVEMDEMVIQYLREAFAFIYVDNSAITGGVRKDSVSTWIYLV